MKITKETIVRLIFLILAVVNVLLEMFNKPLIPIESEAFRQGIDALLLIIATGWGYWKNNSFTLAARSGDELMNSLKIGGEGSRLMYYNQNNYSNVRYDNPSTTKVETISSSGCGVASACIVFNTLAGKELYSISKMAEFSLKNGARDNSGTNMLTLLKALCKDNKAFIYKTTNSIEELKKHLKNGGMAIANQGDCYNVFSTAGHYVVPWKMSGSNVNVVDPQMYSGKYDSYNRPQRIVAKTETGSIVSPAQLDKACSDRNPKYYLISYTMPKTEQKPTESNKPSNSAPTFKEGSVYTLTTNVKVRTGAGTNYAQKKRSQLTADGRKNALNQTYAVLKSGTKFTVQEVKKNGSDIWVKIPSGWICVYYKGDKYAK